MSAPILYPQWETFCAPPLVVVFLIARIHAAGDGWGGVRQSLEGGPPRKFWIFELLLEPWEPVEIDPDTISIRSRAE